MRRSFSDSDFATSAVSICQKIITHKRCLFQANLISDQKRIIKINKESIKDLIDLNNRNKDEMMLKLTLKDDLYSQLECKINELEATIKKLSDQISLLQNNNQYTDPDKYLSCENDLICSITLDNFKDPVIAADGITYEKNAILKWMKKSKIEDTKVRSPMFGSILSNLNLLPNRNLKSFINNIKDKGTNLILLQQYLLELKTNIKTLELETKQQLWELSNIKIKDNTERKSFIHYITCCLKK